MTVLTGEEEYAPDVIEELQKTAKKVVVIDASRKAEELGNVKAANVILLGALVQAMGLDDIDWEEIIRKTVKEKFVELNLKAFAVGKEQMK